jgi:nucleoid-associated protein YgaU
LAKGGEIILNLKNLLKALKLNESTISMILGAIVIVVVGVLVVNYFKDRGGKLPFFSTGNKVEVNQNEVKIHTAVKGDNLWKIAEKYYGSGYNWVDIAKENNLANPGVITEGQKLTIPNVEPKTATVKEVKTVSTEPITGATYQVVKGDCLWTIAVRAYGDGYKWTEIAKANKLDNPGLIHSGNILVLPR